MTRDEFLARCATAYDMGLCKPERLALLREWTDLMLRADDVLFGAGAENQRCLMLSGLRREGERLRRFADGRALTLANDADGYGLVQLSALLSHPCQRCATDTNAWHTRPAFCEHKEA